MKIKSQCLFVLLFTTVCNVAVAQNSKSLPSINIGDKIPDLTIRQIIGSTQKSIRLSDLYHKGVLIIDFWASWCGSCLEEMPVADSIAGKHPNLTILAISHDDSISTANFLRKRKDIPHANIIISSDDKLISKYLKHRGIPHNVWIDKSGIVRLTTAGYAMNEKYINQFLNGIIPKIRMKKQQQGIFKFWKPYHVEDSLIYYRSIFTKYNDTLGGSVASDAALTLGKTKRVFITNQTLTQMYWIAYINRLSSDVNMNAFELHTKDSLRFFFPKPDQKFFKKSKYYSPQIPFEEAAENWSYDNCYCYDLQMPEMTQDSIFSRYMIEDLNRFFNVKGSIEKRYISVSVVKKTMQFDSTKIKRFKAGPYYKQHPGRFFKRVNNGLIIKDRTFEQIIAYFINSYGIDPKALPLVNETGLNWPIELTLNFQNGKNIDYEYLKDLLLEKGLSITTEKREVPILVLRDLN